MKKKVLVEAVWRQGYGGVERFPGDRFYCSEEYAEKKAAEGKVKTMKAEKLGEILDLNAKEAVQLVKETDRVEGLLDLAEQEKAGGRPRKTVLAVIDEQIALINK